MLGGRLATGRHCDSLENEVADWLGRRAVWQRIRVAERVGKERTAALAPASEVELAGKVYHERGHREGQSRAVTEETMQLSLQRRAPLTIMSTLTDVI